MEPGVRRSYSIEGVVPYLVVISGRVGSRQNCGKLTELVAARLNGRGIRQEVDTGLSLALALCCMETANGGTLCSISYPLPNQHI